jgi:L-ribulose-5-phosphate 3-epimerase UlaE
LIANEVGQHCIEFIIDLNDSDKNPLLYKGGKNEILQLIEATSVSVKTIFAYYFMESPLYSQDTQVSDQSTKALRRLLSNSEKMGVRIIVIFILAPFINFITLV